MLKKLKKAFEVMTLNLKAKKRMKSALIERKDRISTGDNDWEF